MAGVFHDVRHSDFYRTLFKTGLSSLSFTPSSCPYCVRRVYNISKRQEYFQQQKKKTPQGIHIVIRRNEMQEKITELEKIKYVGHGRIVFTECSRLMERTSN